MRRRTALLAVLFALVGCAPRAATEPKLPRLFYPEVLSRSGVPADARHKLNPPTGACLARVRQRLGNGGSLLDPPLAEPWHSGMRRLIAGLHPTARQILLQTHGIWLADHIEDAAAIYFPCEIDWEARRGGFVLLDASEYPLDADMRDTDVPILYWHALAGWSNDGDTSLGALPLEGTPIRLSADHAMRYLVLHELGHALSLLSGEFELSERGRFRVGRTDGFVGLSWRMTEPAAPIGRAVLPRKAQRGVAPRAALSLGEWTSVLDALEADPALAGVDSVRLLLPTGAERARQVCAAASKLTEAGFITPTAAVYPTEDYAEMFAHAILAAEGKLTRRDRIRLELPYCGVRYVRSPYYSPWVEDKRRYLERRLATSR